MILHIPRCKLTCPVKFDGCKLKCPFQHGPFLGDMLIFRGTYISYCIYCIYINTYIYIRIYKAVSREIS